VLQVEGVNTLKLGTGTNAAQPTYDRDSSCPRADWGAATYFLHFSSPFAAAMTTPESVRLALAERYEFVSTLGEGGMALVSRMRDRKLDRDVALKVLKPGLAATLASERFLREVRVTAALQHPHILPLFDSGEVEGTPWYAMPFVEGESLRQRLNREGRLGVTDAVNIARQVSSALAYAHRRGVVHRDIKPENILLHDGNAYVADFGIALAVARADTGRLTESGMMMGTPHYLSPEQASGDADVDGRCDQWALGAVLYEMLAGAPPHSGPTLHALLTRIVVEAPAPLAELRPTIALAVETVVMRALAKVPGDRFPTIEAFEEALTIAGATAATGSSMFASPAMGSVPRQSWAARPAMAVGSVMLVVLAAALFARRTPPAPEIGGGGVTAPAVIAVVPCENRTGDPELAWAVEGLADDLVNRLSQLSNLRVLPRGEIIAAAARESQPAAMARLLEASHLVTCSVARAGDRLRVGAQLMQATPPRVLWGDALIGAPSELLAMEDSLLRVVLASVPISMSASESQALADGPTRDGEAQRLYLLGRHHWNRMSGAENARALDYFEQALARDSSFARAYAGVAMVNIARGFGLGPEDPRAALTRARSVLEQGLAARPGDADLLAIRAIVRLWFDRDLSAARRDASAAIAARPDLGVTQQSMQHVLAAEGKLDSALLASARAIRADPTFSRLLSDRAVYEVMAGQFVAARSTARSAVDLDPASVHSLMWLATAEALLGNRVPARAALTSAATIGRGNHFVMTEQALVLALLGDREEARALLDSIASSSTRPELALYAAALGALGDTDAGFRWLERARTEGSRWLLTMPWDPRFAALRADPRFEGFMASLRRGD